MPWPIAGPAGAVLVALTGWLLLTAPVVVAWLATTGYSFAGAVGVGTHLWLLAHGAGATVDGLHLSLMPLGLTLAIAWGLRGVARFTARQARLALVQPDELTAAGRRKVAGQTTALVAVAYAVSVTFVSVLAADPQQTARALVGSAVIGLVAAGAGAVPELGLRVTAGWPPWARAVPQAVAAALLVMTVAAAAVLATALTVHADRVAALEGGLGLGALGAVLLVLIELAYLPTMLIWAGAYAVGAGFTLGPQTVVSPSGTTLGLLPSLPVLGALPAQGAGSWTSLLWLVSGALAGGAAALVVARARREARADETALVGGLSGVLAGLAATLAGALATGDLGNTHLAGIGPRFPQLLIMAVTLIGLSGMVVGLLLGLRRPRGGDDHDEPTTAVVRRPDGTADELTTAVVRRPDGTADELTMVLDP